MFGSLRFFLALTVVLYHLGYHPMGLYIGVSAVMIFYMVSGYVMSSLYSSRFVSFKNARYFYMERVVRIAPQYYFYLLVAFLLFYKNIYAISLTAMNVLSNIALIPLGFSTLAPSLLLFPLIPPTFSLANEVLLYLITPIVLVFPVAMLLALCVSLSLFCLITQGIMTFPDTYFLFFPGPLIFFLLGHFICKSYWKYLGGALLILCLNQGVLLYTGLSSSGFNKEMYLSLYLGVFLLLVLRNGKPHPIDNWLGAVSYGCFLAHMLLQVIFSRYWWGNSSLIYNVTLVVLAIGCGALSYRFIEVPTIRYRYYLRNKNVWADPKEVKRLNNSSLPIGHPL